MVVTEYTIPFGVDDSLIDTISKHMFSTPWQVVDELVINGRDARPKKVTLEVNLDFDYFRVTDDGRGMQGRDQIVPFLTAGGSSKRLEERVDGFAPIGRFGLAKLGLRQIGSRLEFESKREGKSTTSMIDLETQFQKGKDISLEEEVCDRQQHGTILTVRKLSDWFKSEFSVEQYIQQAPWRLPLHEFQFIVNDKEVSPRKPPADDKAHAFKLDFEYPLEQRGKSGRLTGNIYLCNTPYQHYGFHLYVRGRRAINHEHGRFPYLTPPKSGMGHYIVIMADADDLDSRILFDRERFMKSAGVTAIMKHIQSKLLEVRRYYDAQRRLEEENGAAAPPIVVPALALPSVTLRLDEESARIAKNPYEALLHRVSPAQLLEVSPLTTLQLAEGLPYAMVCLGPGRFMVSKEHPAIQPGIAPLEQHGRLVSALVESIARYRLEHSKARGRSLEEISHYVWSQIPQYGVNHQIDSAASTGVVSMSLERTMPGDGAARNGTANETLERAPAVTQHGTIVRHDSLAERRRSGADTSPRPPPKPAPGGRGEQDIAAYLATGGRKQTSRGSLDVRASETTILRTGATSSTNRTGIDPKKNYTIAEIADMERNIGRIKYTLPAIIGARFDNTKVQTVPGKAYQAFLEETRGFVPLCDIMQEISPQNAAVLVNASHIVLNDMELEPFFLNASKLQPAGHTYFVDTASRGAFLSLFSRHRSTLATAYKGPGKPFDEALVKILKKDIAATMGAYHTKQELARVSASPLGNVEDIITTAGLSKHGRFRKAERGEGRAPSEQEYQFKAYVLAAQEARALQTR